jgi:pyrroline-5-carboxylate reductase
MLIAAGQRLGLDAETATTLAVGTATGAAALAAASDESMEKLIERVRSPGGTTAAALDNLEAQNFRDIFAGAIVAARDRAIALAERAHNED